MSEQENREKPVKKRHPLRIIGRILKYLALALLLATLGAGGFAWWVMDSQSGQAWLVKTVNKSLGPAPDKEGISIKLTGIKGSLPFNFEVGVEVYDKHGLWLNAPSNRFVLDWRELPSVLQISELKINDADLQRLPDLPPSQPAPSQPFTLADLKTLLADGQNFLAQKPWWLPQIRLANIGFKNALLPPDILPRKNAETRLAVEADLNASLADGKLLADLQAQTGNADKSPLDLGQISLNNLYLGLKITSGVAADALKADAALNLGIENPVLAVDGLPSDFLGAKSGLDLNIAAVAHTDAQNPSLEIEITGPNAKAGDILLRTLANWRSGSGWRENRLDGSIKLDLAATVSPRQAPANSPLNMIMAPINLTFKANGDLPSLAFAVDLDCPALEVEKHEISDLKLTLKSPELDLPLTESGLAALAQENHALLQLNGEVDKQKISLDSEIFLQRGEQEADDAKKQILRAGLRHLDLHAMGISCRGNLGALILPDKKTPALDGDLKISLDNWRGVGAFMPDQHFAGKLNLAVTLNSGLSNDPASRLQLDQEKFADSPQKAAVNLGLADFVMQPRAGGEGYAVRSLKLEADASDIFGDLSLNAKLDSAGISAAGMNLNAKADVSGLLKGPLSAKVETSGDVKTSLAAVWKPGEVNLDRLNASINPARFLPGSKKSAHLGIAMSSPARAAYGGNGIHISNLDLRIIPSGRLRVNGGLSPDKLDFALSLENLDFKPWQNLVPSIPQGSAHIRLNLSGSPLRPAGNFRAELRRLKIPGTPLAPIGLVLQGALRQGAGGSLLGLKLEVDQATLKALGANTAQVSADIPLLFDPSGIPKLNMNGNLAARIRWDGALGPIWNLVPVADQRLNGRLAIHLDAAGSLAAPRIRGGVNIDRARYENLLLGVLLTDISLRCQLSDQGAIRKIADTALPGRFTVTASVSDGHKGGVNVSGHGDLDGKGLDIKINIDRLKPLRRRDIHVEVSGDLAINGDAVSPDITGKIVVNRGEILLDNLAMTGSVTTLDITQASAREKAHAAAPSKAAPLGNLDINVIMLPRFHVDGRGLGSVWEANLLIEGPLNNPQVTGTINAVSGNFDFLGKIFQLSKGVVTFAGGSLGNPLLDLELTNETPDLTAHIIVTGPVNKMRLQVTSEPSIPRDEIISRVLFGKSISDLSRLEALQLAAAVAQLAGFGGGNGLMNFTKKALGIDVLRIGTSSSGATGADDSGGAGGATIEAGKYITDRLYMGVQQGMKADSTAFIIQFELTPRASLELRSEQNNTWGGLNWKYNY